MRRNLLDRLSAPHLPKTGEDGGRAAKLEGDVAERIVAHLVPRVHLRRVGARLAPSGEDVPELERAAGEALEAAAAHGAVGRTAAEGHPGAAEPPHVAALNGDGARALDEERARHHPPAGDQDLPG